MSIATACRHLRRALGTQAAAQLLAPKGYRVSSDLGLGFVDRTSRSLAMVSTAQVEKVAARPAFPITVDNISPNLVTAQYAGASSQP